MLIISFFFVQSLLRKDPQVTVRAELVYLYLVIIKPFLKMNGRVSSIKQHQVEFPFKLFRDPCIYKTATVTSICFDGYIPPANRVREFLR